MTESTLRALLAGVREGSLSADTAAEQILQALRDAPYEDLGFARIDHHRAVRQGWPEVVFGHGKTPAQIVDIAERIVARGHNLLVTRASAEARQAVLARLPNAVIHDTARTIVLQQEDSARSPGTVLVCCAGTSDLPVAEEAAVCVDALGGRAERLYDVGVSGLHRLLDARPRLERADAIIVVAGMEGALPSVVGGLVQAPVIAVPTSVGYGASFQGLAALLAMLNSCSAGIGVVNIDNGFGAAALACRMLRRRPPPAPHSEEAQGAS
ncbi:MAG TPA: nickel pincer cofactor biosynthesis protein LarB [Vicinamibacterales bacterium]